jgi:hypothetical protein
MYNSDLGNQYSRSAYNRPCPICNDTKGKCQTNYDESFIMCMNTHHEVNGYHFFGVNKSGVWGMHSLTNVVLSEQEKLNKRIEKEKFERLKKESFKKESLPVADRDKAIRAIHKELGLRRADRDRLIKRGLTDSQIESELFFSVRGYTQISDNIPSNLGGVNIDRNGNKYLYFDDGFACPAFDFDGKVIGWQYRSNLTNSGNKYKWALTDIKDKSGEVIKKIQSHLPNGELPITFISGDKISFGVKSSETITQQWLEGGPLPTNFINKNNSSGPNSNSDTVKDSDTLDQKLNLKVIFATEGLLKPLVASSRLGVDTIGASSFNFSGSPEQVKNIITSGGYNCVVLPLDGGVVVNKSTMNHLAKNVKLFESLGCQVFIGWWGQVSKNDNDFDEINSLEQVRLITYETVKTISNTAIFRQWKKDELGKLRGFKADKTIDKPRFYADGAVSDPEIDSILDNNQVIVIRGSKASGKSYMMKQYIKRWQKSGGKVVNIGCRRVLCESQSMEWEITYISDAENESYSLPIIFERDGGLSVVVDSLLKLKGVNWENTLVIFDEFEQFVSHLLTANTAVKDKRGYILQFLEDSLKLSLASGGKIIGLDADSSDLSCDWLEGVTGIKPFKLDNIAKSHNNNCFLFAGDKDGYDDIIREIIADLSSGQRIPIFSDSRKDLQAILMEVKKRFPDLPCEIITSDTVSEKYIRDFIKCPDKTIKDTQVVMLGGSPVMQSGVSINIKGYFNKVYGICTGVIEPSIMRQLLSRIRDNCDRYLWISDKARGVYSNDFDHEKILKSKDTFINSLGDLCGYESAINENLTNDELLEKIKEKLDSQGNLSDINSITKAKLIARRNLALSDYRAVLIDELEQEGYNLQGDYEGTASAVVFGGIDIREAKKEIDHTDAINTNNADNITSIENERLKKKAYPTKNEQYQLLKYFIKDSLPAVAINPLFILNYIIKDRWKLIKAVKRWWFTQNKEVAQKLDIKAIHYQNKVALTGGKHWLEDIKPNMPYVELFERLGLSEFINDGLVINKNSEQLKAFFDRCKDYRKTNGISNRELLRSCGVKFANNVEVVNLLRKVVSIYGFKLDCVDRTKDDNGSTIRHYRIIRGCDNELWTQLIDSFNIKYLNLEPINYDFDLENNNSYDLEFYENISFDVENAKTYTESDLELAPLPTNFVNKIDSSGTGLNQDSVTDSSILPQKLNFEPKLSLNNRKLIGLKANFWDNNNQWVTGFISEIFDFGIQLKDEVGNVSYCDLGQIEVINDENMCSV